MSIEVIRRVLLQEAEAVAALAGRLGPEFEQVVERVASSKGRVVSCGVGKSGLIARKAASTFASTGTPSFFLHAAEAVHGDLGMVTSEDLVLMYSYSGETDELVRLFPSFKAIGATTIVVTGRVGSSSARLADMVLDVRVDAEACPNNLAPTTSTTVMLALSDALAVALMERRHFGPDDFAKFHPSGALGRRLTLTVRDVMRRGDDLPVVSPESQVFEVMRTISRVGAGGACVVDGDALVGYVSDGDLRRWFLTSGVDPLLHAASDLMNTGFTAIEPGLLAVEAMEAFQNHPKKIGEMPVVEGGRLVGLLMLKDLLRSGIV